MSKRRNEAHGGSVWHLPAKASPARKKFSQAIVTELHQLLRDLYPSNVQLREQLQTLPLSATRDLLLDYLSHCQDGLFSRVTDQVHERLFQHMLELYKPLDIKWMHVFSCSKFYMGDIYKEEVVIHDATQAGYVEEVTIGSRVDRYVNVYPEHSAEKYAQVFYGTSMNSNGERSHQYMFETPGWRVVLHQTTPMVIRRAIYMSDFHRGIIGSLFCPLMVELYRMVLEYCGCDNEI